MITVPEGMGFGQMDMGALSGRRKAIRGLRASRKSFDKGVRYLVTPGEASRYGMRPGQVIPPAQAQIPEVMPYEAPAKEQYLKFDNDDLITSPNHSVKVTGWNQISVNPASQGIMPVKGKVVTQAFKPVPVGPGVEILPEEQDFVAETDDENIPGFTSDLPGPSQQFPRRQYPPVMTQVLREEMEVEAEAGVDGLDQWDAIISAAATAAKVGGDIYAKKQAQKAEKRAEKRAAAEESRAAAAAARERMLSTPQFYQGGTGMDATTIALIAAGGLAVVGAAIFLLRK